MGSDGGEKVCDFACASQQGRISAKMWKVTGCDTGSPRATGEKGRGIRVDWRLDLFEKKNTYVFLLGSSIYVSKPSAIRHLPTYVISRYFLLLQAMIRPSEDA